MNRRQLLKSAILGSGAAVSLPAHSPAATPLAANAAASMAAAQAAQAGAWKPLVFDEHQNRTVVALTELMIPATDTPGAKQARVNEYIDLVLHDVEPDLGHRFLMGLGWLDGYALRRHGAPFVDCSEEKQVAMLAALDGAKEPDLEPGAEFFADLKRLTVEGYYTSKIGIDELNKGGVPETFGCQHDGHA